MTLKVHPVGKNQTEVDMGDGVIVLFSYNKPVAAKVLGGDNLRTDTFYSRTTTKHINAWAGKTATEVPQAIIDELANTK